MSLAIDVDEVRAVLLADGWHEVEGTSFAFDAYEFLWWGKRDKEDGDQNPIAQWQGAESTGFVFIEDGENICGPMSSILAVRQ